MNKNNYKPILKKIYDSLQELLQVNKEHKKLSKEQFKNSMTLSEQRFWTILQISLIIFFGGGIIAGLNLFNNDETITPDYDVGIKVVPDRIVLNEKGDINFRFTFTNIGKKNLSSFRVLSINMQRIEDGKIVPYGELVSPVDRDYLRCDVGYSGDILPVGKSCTLEKKRYGCERCFDDKDKKVQFYIYLESVPPINNKIINLTIY